MSEQTQLILTPEDAKLLAALLITPVDQQGEDTGKFEYRDVWLGSIELGMIARYLLVTNRSPKWSVHAQGPGIGLHSEHYDTPEEAALALVKHYEERLVRREREATEALLAFAQAKRAAIEG